MGSLRACVDVGGVERGGGSYTVDNDNDTARQPVTIPRARMPPLGTGSRAYSINMTVYTVARPS